MVACPLIVAGHMAGIYCISAASAYDGPSSTEAHGVGADHTGVLALVGEDDHLVVALALSELKGAYIHPCASTHLLVYFDACGASGMEHQVLGIGHARRIALIGDIYGIFAPFWDVGYPQGGSLGILLVAGGADDAAIPFAEGVVAMVQCRFGQGKSHGTISPPCLTALFLHVESAVVVCTVVNDDVVRLSVSLAGAEHYGSCLFEHRGEVGDDDRLCEQVLSCTV